MDREQDAFCICCFLRFIPILLLKVPDDGIIFPPLKATWERCCCLLLLFMYIFDFLAMTGEESLLYKQGWELSVVSSETQREIK